MLRRKRSIKLILIAVLSFVKTSQQYGSGAPPLVRTVIVFKCEKTCIIHKLYIYLMVKNKDLFNVLKNSKILN